jgi:predicted NUDIX family NTP pyrophosphohydrolase
MQDRTSAVSIKVLLQRTAGPYIWVNRDRDGWSPATAHVRFTPKADKTADAGLGPLCAISLQSAPQRK